MFGTCPVLRLMSQLCRVLVMRLWHSCRDDEIAAPELLTLSEHQAAEKEDEEAHVALHAFLEIRIVCPHQRVPEILRALRKRLRMDSKAKVPEISRGKDRGCPGVPLREGVDLPDPGDEFREVRCRVIRREPLIAELPFSPEIVQQGREEI